MSGCYEELAHCYDALTGDVQYERRAAYLVRLLRRAKRSVNTVLDLACGTGTMTCLLAQKGYEMIGVDLSEEMLSEAMDKTLALEEGQRPLLLHQSMTRLELGMRVDAAVCCLDSLNYLTSPRAVQSALRRVYEHLQPGGVFLFDVNTVHKFEQLDGQVFLDETEQSYCVWRADYSPRSHTIHYGMDLFCLRDDGTWHRTWEEHRERAYTREELTQWLGDAGFTDIRFYGDLSRREPQEGELRMYVSALRGREETKQRKGNSQ